MWYLSSVGRVYLLQIIFSSSVHAPGNFTVLFALVSFFQSSVDTRVGSPTSYGCELSKYLWSPGKIRPVVV